MLRPYDDNFFMQEAIKLAELAGNEGEIPVGAIIVSGNRIIGKGYNQTEKLNDSTAHAEMIAITAAFQFLGAKYLQDCTMYVSLEPCPMCAGALHWSQIDKIVYGASDERKGYTLYKGKNSTSLLHPSTEVKRGLMAEECGKLIKDFFRDIREG